MSTNKNNQKNPWLHIIGLGESGTDSLLPLAKTALESAALILGDTRHLNAVKSIAPKTAEHISWPSPFDSMLEKILNYRGKPVVILTTGDPLWYSVGALFAKNIKPSEIIFYPQTSAFQWAAARMAWPLANTETLSLHGRPLQNLIPFIQPNQRLLILTDKNSTPQKIAALLKVRGFGNSQLTALSHLGAKNEKHFHGTAKNWQHKVPPFHTIALKCIADKNAHLAPRTGLPDDHFHHDGTMTKQEVRAITLARLMPMPNAQLWDVGCGCGSVAIEWMRAAKGATAIGLEPRADRRAFTAQNALALGVPNLDIRAGFAPDGLANLPTPDAIFIGGGLSAETLEICFNALPPLGRLVCNAVSLDSEQLLLDFYTRHGGELTRLQISRAEPIGGGKKSKKIGWKPAMPITQFSMVKR